MTEHRAGTRLRVDVVPLDVKDADKRLMIYCDHFTVQSNTTIFWGGSLGCGERDLRDATFSITGRVMNPIRGLGVE